MNFEQEAEELRRLITKTSIPSPVKDHHMHQHLSQEEKIHLISQHFRSILEILGLDLSNDSINKTPGRIAKMYVQEIFAGLSEENFPKITLMKDCLSKSRDEQVVFIRDITLCSFCEHHFLPFTGVAHFAYIPNGKAIGLSKINRIAQFFAKRPQIQERLGIQIVDCLSNILDTDNVAIRIETKHSCVAIRGVQDDCSHTITQILRGQFQKDPVLFHTFLKEK
jgi:GTP cyclohydrolase I